jgi:ribosomal protein S18 acetylase RimI-like enzyme
MSFDPAVALRMIANSHMRVALGTSEFRDLGGAIVVTSDAPLPALNCMSDFTTGDAQVESLLDLGFSLLRAFDRPPAAELSPLDRPTTLSDRLLRRDLTPAGGRLWMTFAGDPQRIDVNPRVTIKVVDGDDVQQFVVLHSGNQPWLRTMSRSTVLTGLLTPGNTFYLGYVEGVPVATLHLLVEGDTAGLYALGTSRAYRRQGVASTLIARAIADALAAGARTVYLSTDNTNKAASLYEKLGFVGAFETTLWVERERPIEPAKKRRLRRSPKTQT